MRSTATSRYSMSLSSEEIFADLNRVCRIWIYEGRG